MTRHRGLGGREGAILLAHVAEYIPSLRQRAAAGLLGAFADDPHEFEDSLTDYVQTRINTPPSTTV